MGAFNTLHSQVPQTLAHALADSPTGLLAWNGQLLQGVDDDFVLANVAISWFTRTSGSSLRFYFENARTQHQPTEPTTVPIALAASQHDFQSIRRFAERDHAAITSWNVDDAAGHYTAHTDPQLFTDDVQAFFDGLRRR